MRPLPALCAVVGLLMFMVLPITALAKPHAANKAHGKRLLRTVDIDPETLLNRAKLFTEQAQAAEYGEGVDKNPALAAKLYCAAARLGYAEAQYSLGWMYANGRGIDRDELIANTLFARAAQQEHEQAQRMKDRLGDTPEKLPSCMSTGLQDAVGIDDHTAAVDVERMLTLSASQAKVVEWVKVLAQRYAVDPQLVLALISVESNFNPAAVSNRNAQGLMQLIPQTAERFGVRNTYDPFQNLRGGIAYLRWLLAYFQGDVALALAGYNAGEGAVNKYKGIPPYPETQAYVRKILGLFRRQALPYDPSVTQPSPVMPQLRGWRLNK